VPVSEVQRYESELRTNFRASHADLLATIRDSGRLPEGDALENAVKTFTEQFDTVARS
jgi:F-type H+-transporting ATPase subunit alpha